MSIRKATTTWIVAALAVACSRHPAHYSQRIELITAPAVRCVLLTNVDSLAYAFDPVLCEHVEGCSQGYSSVDTTFAIGFTLNALRDKETASSLVRMEASNIRTERTDVLDIPLVERDDQCGNYAYGHYTHETPQGRTLYFFGVVVSNGYSVGVGYQLVNAEEGQFTTDGLALLHGIRIEPY